MKSAASNLSKTEFLTYTMIFCVGSAFSKDSGPDPDLIYKVCLDLSKQTNPSIP